jgi:hypothetical protein
MKSSSTCDKVFIFAFFFFIGCDVKDFGDVTYEQIEGLTVENMTALGHIAACHKEVNCAGHNTFYMGLVLDYLQILIN